MSEPKYHIKQVKVHLFVTGKGERTFISELLREVIKDQNTFTDQGGRVVRFEQPEFIGQHRPLEKNRQPLRVTGTHKVIPTELVTKVSFKTNKWLQADPECLVLLIDDLEKLRGDEAQAAFANYRAAIDHAIRDKPESRRRASVHFFIPMLEAYYFADPEAVNAVLSTSLPMPTCDVEEMEHPKNQLKQIVSSLPGKRSFDEVEDGTKIVATLSLDRILAEPKTCRALRTLVGWCRSRLGAQFDERFRLADGEFHPLTCEQIPWPSRPLTSP